MLVSLYASMYLKAIAAAVKKQQYIFWHTYHGQETDLLEYDNELIRNVECKWKEHKKSKIPTTITKAYPHAKFLAIDLNNYLSLFTNTE